MRSVLGRDRTNFFCRQPGLRVTGIDVEKAALRLGRDFRLALHRQLLERLTGGDLAIGDRSMEPSIGFWSALCFRFARRFLAASFSLCVFLRAIVEAS